MTAWSRRSVSRPRRSGTTSETSRARAWGTWSRAAWSGPSSARGGPPRASSSLRSRPADLAARGPEGVSLSGPSRVWGSHLLDAVEHRREHLQRVEERAGERQRAAAAWLSVRRRRWGRRCARPPCYLARPVRHAFWLQANGTGQRVVPKRSIHRIPRLVK